MNSYRENIYSEFPLQKFVGRFILIKGCPLGQDLVVEAVMLQPHFGQQINSMVVLPLKRNSKNGQVRLVQIFPSFSPMEQHIVLVEVRYVFIIRKFSSFMSVIFLCQWLILWVDTANNLITNWMPLFFSFLFLWEPSF